MSDSDDRSSNDLDDFDLPSDDDDSEEDVSSKHQRPQSKKKAPSGGSNILGDMDDSNALSQAEVSTAPAGEEEAFVERKSPGTILLTGATSLNSTSRVTATSTPGRSIDA
eukprot:scaffold726_cov262-Pinguiococcus_pyrenoidosus.AAC.26